MNTSMPLVNCIVNDGLASAVPIMQKTLLQFITLVQIKLVCYIPVWFGMLGHI